jgi:hypothetical protein
MGADSPPPIEKAGAQAQSSLNPADARMLDEIQKAQFQYFKQESDPVTGLTKDRSSDASPASIAATGFSLTAYGVAADHGWVSRDEAADYTLKVLNTLSSTPQGDKVSGQSGNHGFFYHFLNPHTGLRSDGHEELSTVDTALLMSGVLYAKNYYSGNNAKEAQIRNLSEKLYERVDWNWAMNKDGRMSMGWTPESGFIKTDWQGYNEAPIMMIMGMGSPTHPLPAKAWDTYMSTAEVSQPYGHKQLTFGPLFGHQFPQVWLDFRGTMDATNRKLGMDYFQNTRQAVLGQHDYAIDNPKGFRGYGALDWGLTASDGPDDVCKNVNGKTLNFHTYAARGFPYLAGTWSDDGTLSPSAVAASLPFAPEIVMPTLRHWLNDRPEIVGPMGFKDAFNPSFDQTKPSGWVDPEYLGIDQGPTLLMLENYRNGSVWKVMKNDDHLNAGLQKAGFTPGAAVATDPTKPIS